MVGVSNVLILFYEGFPLGRHPNAILVICLKPPVPLVHLQIMVYLRKLVSRNFLRWQKVWAARHFFWPILLEQTYFLPANVQSYYNIIRKKYTNKTQFKTKFILQKHLELFAGMILRRYCQCLLLCTCVCAYIKPVCRLDFIPQLLLDVSSCISLLYY